VAPDVIEDIVYHGPNNFTGWPVPGYEAPVAILTEPAAEALAQVQRAMAPRGLGLKVFDAYRPTRAVEAFIRWAHDGAPDDPALKARYYPNLDKSKLFDEGYLAEKSGHSRGSTADLTVIDKETGKELDFGTAFDYFDPLTHLYVPGLTDTARGNRNMLVDMMADAHMASYAYEWWHFTLEGEPFPDTYFDFVVK
jgi:D-alanyl-D-alanine dipeptidase